MALNPFFLHGSKGEQNLVQDLVNEQLKMFGVEVYYIPRTYGTEKTVLEEVSRSNFGNAIPLEAYVETFDGYSGAGTLLSKFGVQELDDLTLIISRERYEEEIQKRIEPLKGVKLASRPKEGDLIYFPLGDRLFEIKYVEHEKPFYQLQKNYVYELRCELFIYNDEEVDTGIDFIDDNVEEEGYIQTMTLAGIASQATAVTTLVDGGVRNVIVSRRGSGYTHPPQVAFSSAPSGGTNPVGVSSMISGLVDFCEPNEDLSRVQAVNLTNPGSGYTVAPRVGFMTDTGAGAYAITNIADGVCGIITITNGGGGYVGIPTVAFAPDGYSGIGSTTIPAVVKAVVSAAGSVTALVYESCGGWYTDTPEILIAPPVQTGGTGTFNRGEDIVGTASSATAQVKTWNAVTRELRVGQIVGTFQKGEYIVGQETSTRFCISDLNSDDLPETGFPQNATIESEADNILDFSESNPFGNV